MRREPILILQMSVPMKILQIKQKYLHLFLIRYRAKKSILTEYWRQKVQILQNYQELPRFRLENLTAEKLVKSRFLPEL